MHPSAAPATWDQASARILVSPPGMPPLRLEPVIALAGRTIAPSAWTALPDGGARAVVEGCTLTVRIAAGAAMALSLTNRSGAPVRLEALGFRITGGLLDTPGPELRVFAEGWAMTTPARSFRPGERMPPLNPDYRPFASPEPAGYDEATPDRFDADHVAVVGHPASGRNLLVGFATSRSQTTRIGVRLEARGAAVEARSLAGGIAVADGATLAGEELVVLAGPDAWTLLERFADLWAARMGARPLARTATGWCSYTSYFEQVSEAAVLENARWIRDHRSGLPLEIVQLDGGYTQHLGDWLQTDPVKFPGGLEHLAREVRACGLTAGLWLAPVLAGEGSRLFAEHPDWIVRDRAGAPVWVMGDGPRRAAAVDPTAPGAEAWYEGLFATLARWGFGYVKLDFLAQLPGAVAQGGLLHDRGETGLGALRRGLAAMRRGLGADRTILVCTCPLGAAAGIADACRIGPDVLPAWNRSGETFAEAPTMANCVRNILNRRYLHRRLWTNDPDAAPLAGGPGRLTLDEARLWTAAQWFAGGLVLSGDRLATLEPERLSLQRLLLAEVDAFDEVRPLDLFAEELPPLWLARCGTRTAIAAFNLHDTPRTLRLDPGSTGPLRELWSGRRLGAGAIDVALRPHECQVFLGGEGWPQLAAP